MSLAVIWHRREEIKLAPKQVCLWGLGVIVMALAFHWLGAKMRQTRISLVSLIFCCGEFFVLLDGDLLNFSFFLVRI